MPGCESSGHFVLSVRQHDAQRLNGQSLCIRGSTQTSHPVLYFGDLYLKRPVCSHCCLKRGQDVVPIRAVPTFTVSDRTNSIMLPLTLKPMVSLFLLARCFSLLIWHQLYYRARLAWLQHAGCQIPKPVGFISVYTSDPLRRNNNNTFEEN